MGGQNIVLLLAPWRHHFNWFGIFPFLWKRFLFCPNRVGLLDPNTQKKRIAKVAFAIVAIIYRLTLFIRLRSDFWVGLVRSVDGPGLVVLIKTGVFHWSRKREFLTFGKVVTEKVFERPWTVRPSFGQLFVRFGLAQIP